MSLVVFNMILYLVTSKLVEQVYEGDGYQPVQIGIADIPAKQIDVTYCGLFCKCKYTSSSSRLRASFD